MTTVSKSGITLISCPVNYMLLFSNISGPSSHMAYFSALSGLAFSIPGGSLHLFDHIFDLLHIASQSIFFPLITTFCRFLCLIISPLRVPLNLTKEKEGWACCLIRASFTGHKVSAAALGYDMAFPSAFPGVSLVQTLVIWVVVMYVDSGSDISD